MHRPQELSEPLPGGCAAPPCRTTVPLAGIEAGDLPARADERHRLEQALGVEHSPLADIQSGILVLSPLLASAVSLFLPG